ncbi:Glutamate--tRNA ligase [Shewanella denitrificans OS217]|uniref:Glutamyl-Q tRNA(Asp) synthetase n=1 Tax=Shewanella denitrificans (strain OS217 / ATCC BAA-1090 / DSM 15013) TaxID=318161 RepID=Q12JC9_SHEDO|nr:tRNA glutamyl-Q(34) synthetase GluQRS [Shewanella denitrificans]ABE56447.1 Glutamate--tRNA ligase [Shewanella denitrificans OS217]
MTALYRGRFAPSPSGPLHFGSLVAALGSYLRAKSLGGQWLVRIEDIDPPREIAGASSQILKTLTAYGFEWDEDVLYQSQRTAAYQAQIDSWIAQGQAYFCQCSRKQIQAMGGTYDGRCNRCSPKLTSGAVRIVNHSKIDRFDDVLMGTIIQDAHFSGEDFIIKRSDGLYAYQLAVVLDDAYQGITEVVRGSDLLQPTVRQISLYRSLGLAEPGWLHLPLACTEPGFKLSKQNHAQGIDLLNPGPSINAALGFLGQAAVELASPTIMLEQAVAQFKLEAIPVKTEILL